MKNLVRAFVVVVALAVPALAGPEQAVIPVPEWTFEHGSPPVFDRPEVWILDGNRFPAPPTALDRTPYGYTAAGIANLLAAEVREAGGRIEAAEDELRVTGSDGAVDLARRRVAAIDRFLSGRSSVAVSLVAVPDGDLAGILDAALVARRLEDGTADLLWIERFDLHRGEGALRESLTDRSFVLDLDTEVAQQASIADPISAVLRTGRRVFIACRSLSGEEAVVTLSLGLSHLPDDIRVEQLATGTLDLPEVPFLSLTTDIRLARGATEVIVVDHPFEPGLLAVLVSLGDVPAAEDLPFTLVDLAALAGNPDVAATFQETGVVSEDDYGRNGYDEAYGPGPNTLRNEAVDSLVQGLEDAGLNVVQLSPAVVAFTGSAAARARAEGLLSRAGTALTVARRTFRLPWSRLQRSSWFDPVTGTVDAGTLARAVAPDEGLERAGTVVAPMAGGTPFLLRSGTWRRFLAAMDVEIAQGAAIIDPVVRSHFEGEALLVRRSSMGGSDALTVVRSGCVLLDLETRELDVRMDIEGSRFNERDHRIDILTTAVTCGRFPLRKKGTSDVRRVGDEAVIDCWSR